MNQTTVPSPSLPRSIFLSGLGRLLANYRSTLAANEGDALTAVWWDVLSGKPWVTPAIFDLAVSLVLVEVDQYMPTIAGFVAYCQGAKRSLERSEQNTERLALLAPVASPQDTARTNAAKEAARRQLADMLASAKIGDPKPRRAVRVTPSEYRDNRRTVRVQWADGQESIVTLNSNDSAKRAQRWLDRHLGSTA